MKPFTLDLSSRSGIAVREVVEALRLYIEEHDSMPDTLVLPHDAGRPFISDAGRWGTFRGVPILYQGVKK